MRRRLGGPGSIITSVPPGFAINERTLVRWTANHATDLYEILREQLVQAHDQHLGPRTGAVTTLRVNEDEFDQVHLIFEETLIEAARRYRLWAVATYRKGT